ncbi:MAG: hypothetical protein J07HX5_01831 [halophilic archaeon J07HX5]|nr:MAG: hypothetical protein J07HX5_01831 [halophilic archaeon J07HX5]
MPVDCVPNPIGQDLVLVGPTLFLEIISNTGSDSVAGNLLAALAGKQNKRKIRILCSNGLQELKPVHLSHLVIRDDAVRRLVVELLQPLINTCGRPDGELFLTALKKRFRQVGEGGLVIDVDDGDLAVHNSLC